MSVPAVNTHTPWQMEYCGTDIRAHDTFYSKGEAMIMQFHSDAHAATQDHANRGFIGRFRFINKGTPIMAHYSGWGVWTKR